jgi:hypothetical protein
MFIAIKTDILIHKYCLQVLGCFFYNQNLTKKNHYLCNFLNISDVEINIETEVKTPSQ